jgi:hypothetical protein
MLGLSANTSRPRVVVVHPSSRLLSSRRMHHVNNTAIVMFYLPHVWIQWRHCCYCYVVDRNEREKQKRT